MMAGFYVNLLVFGLLAFFSQTNCKNKTGICGPPRSDGSPHCCNYFYADGDQCVECLAGYKSNKGKNCTEPCDFPDYGARCHGICNCSQEDCHHIHGCLVLGTTANLVTTTETTFFSAIGTITGITTLAGENDCVDRRLKLLVPIVGAVLVVIMIIINIVNIHHYMKHQEEEEEPIEEDV